VAAAPGVRGRAPRWQHETDFIDVQIIDNILFPEANLILFAGAAL